MLASWEELLFHVWAAGWLSSSEHLTQGWGQAKKFRLNQIVWEQPADHGIVILPFRIIPVVISLRHKELG